MLETMLSKPLYRILTELTGETRVDVALYLVLKEFIKLKLEQVEWRDKEFEKKYQMNFARFKEAWDSGKIRDKYSYRVEKDYWEWEASVTDRKRLQEFLKWLP